MADALNKAFSGNKLSLKDTASPFPLLNPGNTCVILLRATGNKTRAVVEDLVYGLYAFLVRFLWS